MKYYLVLLHLLWSIVFFTYGVEACNELDITYIERDAVNYGIHIFPVCSLTATGYKWWRSSTECGPFNQVSDCSSSICDIDTSESQLQRNFYYCCTSSDVTDIEKETQKSCFHINICTQIVTTQEDIDRTTGFFGQLLPVYIQLYGEPVPNLDNVQLRLMYNNTRETLSQSHLVSAHYGYSAVDGSLITWVLFIQVPEVDVSIQSGTLVLTVTFGTVEGCSTSLLPTVNIRLLRAVTVIGPTDVTTESPTTTAMATTMYSTEPATTTTLPSTTASTLPQTSCVQWIVPFVIFLVATLLLLVITMTTSVSLCVLRSRKQSVQAFSHHNGVNGAPRQRPGSLSYNALRPSASVTPTPNLNSKSLELHHFSDPSYPIKTTAELDLFSIPPHQMKTATATNPQPESPGDSGHYEEIPGLSNKGDNSDPPPPAEYISAKMKLSQKMESPSTEV